jgi:hypothetical protein
MVMIKKVLKKFVMKVMDVDDTEAPVSQLQLLRDFLSRHRYEFSDDFDENLATLKRKHMVDSFVVTNTDGSVILSSEGNGHMEGIVGTAMYSYIQSELPGSESVLVKKDDGWFMIFSIDKKIYIVKAGCELSNIELKALANELHLMIPKGTKFRKDMSISGVAN